MHVFRGQEGSHHHKPHEDAQQSRRVGSILCAGGGAQSQEVAHPGSCSHPDTKWYSVEDCVYHKLELIDQAVVDNSL